MVERFIFLNEIFYSIIGESSFVGYPSVFVRLAGCNLNCKYCDTKYALKDGKYISFKNLISDIEKFGMKRVLITGGEPLWQRETIPLIEELLNRNFTLFLETNGTISLKNVPREVFKIVDVKTPDSGEGNSFLMENLRYLKSGDNLKFVICSTGDFYWSVDFVKSIKMEKGVDILFSPAHGFFSMNQLVQLILKEKLDVRLNLQIHRILGIK